MNIAPSSARFSRAVRSGAPARRHPAGLMAVLALHVLVAGALLTAHSIRTSPAEPSVATLIPEPDKAPAIATPDEALPPPPTRPPRVDSEPPKFVVDPDVDPLAVTHEKVLAPLQPHPGEGETARDEQVALAEPVRLKPRAGTLNAGAAQCRPAYPGAALRAGATGVSRLRFTIDPSGQVTNAQILQPSGPTREHHLLDQAAAAALAQCPVTVGTDEAGRATASSADVDYVWTLN
jgi:protein TonB